MHNAVWNNEMIMSFNKNSLLMGIDLGSSFFKVDIFDGDMHHLAGAGAPVVYDCSGGHIEMSVADCEKALHDAIEGALSQSGCSAEDISAVAFTSQAQTFTVRTPEGDAKSPFISWRDNRCASGNPAELLDDFGRHCSMAEYMPALTVSKLAVMQNLVGADDQLLWLPTWFVMELAGRAVVDVNLAAMSGLYSLQSGEWWREALQLCGISPGNLPDLLPLGSVAGLTTDAALQYGLPVGIPVVLAGNDQTAGAYSAGIHESGSLLISLGTAQVAYASLQDMPESVSGTMRGPYPGSLHYRLAADDFGAGTINWACEVLPGITNAQDFDRAAASAPEGCHGVQFMADGPSGSGSWIGAEESQVATAEKARAVLETLVERMGIMVEKLVPDPKACNVIVCGGGSKSELWCELLSRRLGCQLTRMDEVSPSAGAARMAKEILA